MALPIWTNTSQKLALSGGAIGLRSSRALQSLHACWVKGTGESGRAMAFWTQQRSGGSHDRCHLGAFEPVVELGSLGQTLRRLAKRSRPVKAIPFGRLVLQVRGPDRIGAFQSTSMKTKKHIRSSAGPKASRQSKSKKQSWKVVHPHAAGIDIGATEHYVAVPPDAVAWGRPR